ncbi:MAG TPA: SDR family NAD(P)-dependent oxidoreductase [Pseudomonadales bacterium]|nr:SDR family NAD(P)-dependent oxidoreductase [Pseudomonadales bacterium]
MQGLPTLNVLILGGSGGIGAAFVASLCQRECVTGVVATYFRHQPSFTHPKLSWHRVDPTSEVDIAALCQALGQCHWVINAVGMLHTQHHGPEKTIKRLNADFTLENFRVNTLPTMLLAKYLDKNFKGVSPALFATVSAKVGSISDNQLGGWISYRASKAALNMALKTIALEWRLRLPQVCVVAIHPGTTDTALSKPFQANVPEGKLFTPAYSVQRMLDVLDTKTPEHSGRFWSWDGSELPW